jgi:hypothetical protein
MTRARRGSKEESRTTRRHSHCSDGHGNDTGKETIILHMFGAGDAGGHTQRLFESQGDVMGQPLNALLGESGEMRFVPFVQQLGSGAQTRRRHSLPGTVTADHWPAGRWTSTRQSQLCMCVRGHWDRGLSVTREYVRDLWGG